MTIDIQSTRILFRNSDGDATFDSDKRNLLLPSFASGSFPIRAVSTSNSGPRIFQEDFTLRSNMHAAANIVIGFWNTSAVSRAHSIGGGDHVLLAFQDYMRTDESYITSVTGEWRFSTCVWFRMWCSGGVLRSRVFYRVPGGSEIGVIPFNVNFWVFCGTLDY